MVLIGALELLIILGATVVIGYVGNAIFGKTRIPDVLWLILFGLFLGPVFGLVDRTIFLALAPFLSAVAILVILFDAGLDLDVYEVIRTVPRSFVVAVTNMILSILAVGLVSSVLLGFDLIWGFVLGAIVGGSSSPEVLTMVRRLKVRQQLKDVLRLESFLTDPLSIVLALAFVNFATVATVTSTGTVSQILAFFSVGAVLGLVAGLLWLFALDRLKGRPFDHLLTLAVAFLLYASLEALGGSGAVGALVFGLVIGNGSRFSEMLKLDKKFEMDGEMKDFQDEVTFFIRSFFFVFLGIVIVINAAMVFVGVLIAALLLLLRIVSVKTAFFHGGLSPLEEMVAVFSAPQGVSTAVLALLLAVLGVPYGNVIAEVVFVVIIASVIASTLGMAVLGKVGRAAPAASRPRGRAKPRAAAPASGSGSRRPGPSRSAQDLPPSD